MKPLFRSNLPPDRQDWLRFKQSTIAQWLLRMAGWQVDWHGLPGPRGMIIAYPHTSNWDFVVGILVKWAVGVPLFFWAKEALFRGVARYTIGPVMRYWGAVPVDRRSAQGMIDDTLAQMRGSDYFWLALAPEGTRSYVPHFRGGFYRVALAAACPLGLAAFDFKHKCVVINTFINLTGDEAADMKRIADYYAQYAHGHTPANAGGIHLKKPTP